MTARLAGNEVNSPLQMSCCEDRGRPSGAALSAALDGFDREFSLLMNRLVLMPRNRSRQNPLAPAAV